MTEIENGKAHSVIIPTEHQSAPKEHWMNKELAAAAEEIDKGQFTPKLANDDYFYLGEEQLLWQHPRVIEALERLKSEIRESKNPQELLEKKHMLHEMNEMAAQKDCWDGQGRWIGKDNEQERQGEILAPAQFMRRLEKVIGRGRVELHQYAIMGRVALLIKDPEPSSLIMQPYRAHGKIQVGTLQWPLGTEWMVMAFTEYGVPKYAKFLGWRTALLSMITLHVITEEEAHKAFPLREGQHASMWYRQQLYELRGGKA